MISEDQQSRIKEAVTEMIHEVYKTHLRKMQSNMHLCAVNCCDDLVRQPSLDSVQSCIEDCTIPLMRAQDYMQHELGIFQTKLQNCVLECTDEVRGCIPLKTNESDIAKYRYQFERCTMKCVDKHLSLIPSMMRSMKTVLENGPDNIKQA